MKNGSFRAIITNYKYVTSENSVIGVIIYFKSITPDRHINTVNSKGIIMKKRDYLIVEDWNKLKYSGVGVRSEIQVFVKTTFPYVQYDFMPGAYIPNIMPIAPPHVCPLCGEKLNIHRGASKICCTNIKCKRYDVIKLTRFIKFCLNVANFSYKVMYFLYINNEVKSIMDIYTYLKRNMLKPSDELRNRFLDQVLAASRNVKKVDLAVLIYSLLPQLTPAQAWRYASTDLVSWTKLPNRLFTYNGEKVRQDRSDVLVGAFKLHHDYLAANASEIALLNEKLVVEHNINPDIHKKTFYLLTNQSFSKEYFSERIRLYGGKIDTLKHDIRDAEDMKNIDVVIGANMSSAEESLVAKGIRSESYYWLRTQLNASTI